MLAKVISGGQTGADLAALSAARTAGIATGGYAAKGWLTEAGPMPRLADFALVEAPVAGYPARTRLNVALADAALWFGDPRSPGGKLTLSSAGRKGIPCLIVPHGSWDPAARAVSDVVAWLREHVFPAREGGVTLLVAGNRESSAPGIGNRVEAFLGRTLGLLREGEARP